MLHCEPYGGLLQHTWFDRDLSVAGRVLMEDSKSGSLEHRLVYVPRPVARIPMLSIHLQREIYDQGFNPNKQTQCTPLLFNDAAKKEDGVAEEELHPDVVSRHHPELVRLLARELGCETRAIVGFDLNLVDTQPGQLWGVEEEYVAVGRLDNLCSSFLAVRALLDTDASLAQETGVRVAVLFDNEE
ncbi:M18 aminopeptidase I zinc metalloprotease, partial [Helicosporidium sp. ATCC 50920]